MIDNGGNKLLSGELLDFLINKELYLECSRGKKYFELRAKSLSKFAKQYDMPFPENPSNIEIIIWDFFFQLVTLPVIVPIGFLTSSMSCTATALSTVETVIELFA